MTDCGGETPIAPPTRPRDARRRADVMRHSGPLPPPCLLACCIKLSTTPCWGWGSEGGERRMASGLVHRLSTSTSFPVDEVDCVY